MIFQVIMLIPPQFLVDFEANKDAIARGVSEQMGKPYSQAAGEVGTVIERATAMIGMAKGELADLELPENPGFLRKISKEAVGVVLTVVSLHKSLKYPLAQMCGVLQYELPDAFSLLYDRLHGTILLLVPSTLSYLLFLLEILWY